MFALSFEQFKAFAVKTGYIKKKGIHRESFHIDRREEDKGYTSDNIQVLKNHLNVKKYLAWSHDQNGKPSGFKTVAYKPQPEVAGVPF